MARCKVRTEGVGEEFAAVCLGCGWGSGMLPSKEQAQVTASVHVGELFPESIPHKERAVARRAFCRECGERLNDADWKRVRRTGERLCLWCAVVTH